MSAARSMGPSPSNIRSLRRLTLMLVLGLSWALTVVQPVRGGSRTKSEYFSVDAFEDAEAERLGYERVDVDLGSQALSFSANVVVGTEISVLAGADDLVPPGRDMLAELFQPEQRDTFAISVVAYAPGFAAEAYIASQQALFEAGYRLAESDQGSLVQGQSIGLIFSDETPVRAARSLCANRDSVVLCFLMEFDIEYETEAMRRAAVFVGSLAFENGRENAFADGDVVVESLPLENGTVLRFDRPAAWEVSENDYAPGQAGRLQMYIGELDNQAAFLSFSASQGAIPQTEEGLREVGTGLASNLIDSNPGTFTDLRLLEEGASKLSGGTDHRFYAFTADRDDGGVSVQIRVSLLIKDGMRYAVLMLTNYTPHSSDFSAFLSRWAGTTAEDLAVQSIDQHGS